LPRKRKSSLQTSKRQARVKEDSGVKEGEGERRQWGESI
jgi:hypothetical protein